ncbi:tolB protein precursor [Candidatus Blochmanniella floridana]|uniref:Tol-Pal system protein TolB n=1 Tax=Blochmanniella floridana TaxID=203907 RepID=TOLB_BLOFL|nr:RecName: Full=Tol-Pal system protein TolB; Flags: Precursor [Candidatus Blochmannia floridanus]CAD83405.1 tolB protein precursor [Candidatus Blochmannia floridanus]
MTIFQKSFILLIIWNFSLFAFSDMKIEITHGINTAHPIAVIPFINNENITHELNNDNIEDIASIIAADLRNSGKFNTLPIAYLPYQPSKLTDIIPTFWEKLGINTVVLGAINIKNENYVISYQLIDTSNNPALVILDNQYEIEKKHLRYTAHTISDEIFEKLTGIKGVFCTRIAYILYTNNIKYAYELCTSDYDGHNQVSICRSSEPLMSPAWSPDGKKLAYVTFASGHSELIIQTLTNRSIDNIIQFPNHNGAPAWSPDGKKLAFSLSKTGSLNLYIMDLSSNNIQQITSNRYNNTEPSWFPDSQNLAYTSDQGGVPQVYKININNNRDSHRISWLNGSNQKPNISMDGTFMVMVNRNKGKQYISKLNFLTGEEETLTADSVLADTPSISPNGIMFMYSSIILNNSSSELYLDKKFTNIPDNNQSILSLASIDGKFKAHLNGSTGSIRFPTWSSLSCSY